MSTKPKRETKPALLAGIPSPAADTPHATAAPATFPEDTRDFEKRGPGRPPKICATCSRSASECKCGKLQPSPAIDEATVKCILNGFSELMALSLSVTTGVEHAKLAPVWKFQESQLIVMAPAATTLANKYLPDLFKDFQDEVRLLVVMLPILISKVAITKALISAHKNAEIPPAAKTTVAATTPEKPHPLGERAAAA